MDFRVELRNIEGWTTSLGIAGSHALVVDRPSDAGGGHGFNGGELLHLAVGGCVSNDLFREAAVRGIRLTRVVVTVDGDYAGSPAVSTGISYSVDIEGDASKRELQSLVEQVDAIAEIPNSLRRGTPVNLATASVNTGG